VAKCNLFQPSVTVHMSPPAKSDSRLRQPWIYQQPNVPSTRLCDQLNNATGSDNLLLSELADPAGADDEGNVGKATLSEDLGVAEGEEVEDGDGVGLLAGDVGLTLLKGDEGPQLLDVDGRLPEVVLLLVEVTHTDLSEVTGICRGQG